MAKKSGSPISWLVSLLSRLFGRGGSSSKALPSQQPNEIVNQQVPNRFFGILPTVLYESPDSLESNIPLPLYHVALALKDFHTIEGIFRVSGVFSEMNTFKDTFEKGDIPNFSNIQSIHSVAGLFELWFRELPEPVTTHGLYDEFMSCIDDEKIEIEDSLGRIHEKIKKLPEANQTVLAFFARFMSGIASFEAENKMGTKNLGLVFGSVLLGSGVFSFSLAMKQTLEYQGKIIQLMIENVDRYFPLDEFPYPKVLLHESN